MTELALHTSAATLWPDLKAKAGLTGARSGGKGAYDHDFLADLKHPLFKGADGSLDALILASELSAEQLIRAFFATLKPFAMAT
jgi:hypothetical protein